METLYSALSQFHWLRPWWLLLVIPALALFFTLRHFNSSSHSWSKIIAPELLPFMLDNAETKRHSKAALWLAFWVIGSIAAAGPTWQKIPLPVHKSQQPLVILFDLSPSMLVQDIKPDRLTRAKLKLIDLLKQRKEGTTALISYAGESFVVSPLTDDANTIANMVPALHPNIMPLQGSQAEHALEQAIELLANTGENRGDILFITDDINYQAADTINSLLRSNPDIRLSILGVGTLEGGPIPLGSGGFAKDSRGSIVIPKLKPASLTQLATRHGGLCVAITADDADLAQLSSGFKTLTDTTTVIDERTTDTWHDQGYWLVILLLPMLAVMFRRGAILCLLLLPAVVPQPAQAIEWDDLWLTQNQQAAKALAKGNTETAQAKFKDNNWKAASAYKSGDYETAAELYQDNLYNQGNALAKMGKLEDALASYEQALKVNPQMEDAQFNKELVEQLLKQQQQDPQDSSEEQKNDQSNQDQSAQDQQQNQPDSPGEDSEQSPSESDSNEQQQPSDNNETAKDEQKKPQPEDSNKDSEADTSKSEQEQESNQPEQNNESAQTDEPEEKPGEQPSLQQQPEAGSLTDEERQQMDQWLRQIPDDPGGLLRKKFYHQSQKRAMDQPRGLQPPSENKQRW